MVVMVGVSDDDGDVDDDGGGCDDDLDGGD
jgi:hypothetical protein